MPKIKVTISEEELITDSIIEDNIHKYKEDNGTKVVLDMNNNTLIRENNEIYMKYDFNNKKGNLVVKELDKVFDLDMAKVNIVKEDKLIEIKYNIDEEEFTYRLEVL